MSDEWYSIDALKDKNVNELMNEQMHVDMTLLSFIYELWLTSFQPHHELYDFCIADPADIPQEGSPREHIDHKEIFQGHQARQ